MKIIDRDMIVFEENELEEAEKKQQEMKESGSVRNVWIETTCSCGYPVRTVLYQYKEYLAGGERPRHAKSQHEWDDKFR